MVKKFLRWIGYSQKYLVMFSAVGDDGIAYSGDFTVTCIPVLDQKAINDIRSMIQSEYGKRPIAITGLIRIYS